MPSIEAMLHNSHDHDFDNSKEIQWKHAMAGGVAAAVTRVFAQPLDVLKIRFQLQVEPLTIITAASGRKLTIMPPPMTAAAAAKSKYTSLFQATQLILREEGARAFWKGHTPAQVLSIIYGMAQFWGYEQLKVQMKKQHFHQDHKNISNFCCGGLAGAFGTFVTTPLDVIRTRLIAQDNRRGYPNTVRAGITILQQDGIRGVYRGLLPGILQVTPLVGINFMFYNLFCKSTVDVLSLESKSQIPAPVTFVNGAVAGLLSKAMVYPLDLAKKRMQIQGFSEHRRNYGQHFECNGFVSCFKSTIKKEGLLGLYKGMTPSIYKAALTSAFNFCIYDNIVNLIVKHNN